MVSTNSYLKSSKNMKRNNYLCLELGQELVSNGVLIDDSDFVWHKLGEHWSLRSRLLCGELLQNSNYVIPAPTFQDLWDKLPWFIVIDKQYRELVIEKYDNVSYISYDCLEPIFNGINTCDVAANMLLWLRKNGVIRK